MFKLDLEKAEEPEGAGVRNQRKDMLCQILRNQDQDWKCMKGINLEDKALEAYT